MKKIIIFIIIVFHFSLLQAQSGYYEKRYLRNEDFVYQPNIRTVLLYKMGFEMSEPIIELNSDDKLVLSFDDLSEDYVRYEYTVIHCDADWNNSDLMPNEYLETFTDDYINDFEYSINTMQDYVHYSLTLPNDVIRMKLSGNYLLKVYPAGRPDAPSLTRRFFVVDHAIRVDATVKQPYNVSERNYRHELRFSINLLGLRIDDPQNEIKMTIRQNGRWDNAITNLKPWEMRDGQLWFKEVGGYVFDAGNDFRYFDIKSLKYNSMRINAIEYDHIGGYQVFLHNDEVRKKYLYSRIQESINGRFLIKTEDFPNSDLQAEYVTVNFFLPYPNPLVEGKIYLMGGLTQWQFLKVTSISFYQIIHKLEMLLLSKVAFMKPTMNIPFMYIIAQRAPVMINL